MALIKHAAAKDLVRDAYVLDLGDLHREGELIRERARAEAAKIVEEAKAERERLLEGVQDEGFQAGYAEGLEKGAEQGRQRGEAAVKKLAQEQIGSVETVWLTALEEFFAERARLLRDAHADLLRLSISIAERVVKRTCASDPEVVRDQMASAIGLVLDGSRLVIEVNPEDFELAGRYLPELISSLGRENDAQVVANGAVSPGGVRVNSLVGSIDAGIESQLDRIAAALVPGGGGLAPRLAKVEDHEEDSQGSADRGAA